MEIGAQGRYLEVVVRGEVARADDILRAVSLQSGGFIAAARNPIAASYVKKHAAIGAISYALRLGEAMLAAQPAGAEAVIQAVVQHTKGRVLGRGPVRNARVDTRDSFDFARFVVDDPAGPLTLHTMNEYMAVDRGAARLSTFPDLICTLSLETGLPVSVAQMREGTPIAVLVNDKADLPMGTGAREPDAYFEVEAALGHRPADLCAGLIGGAHASRLRVICTAAPASAPRIATLGLARCTRHHCTRSSASTASAMRCATASRRLHGGPSTTSRTRSKMRASFTVSSRRSLLPAGARSTPSARSTTKR